MIKSETQETQQNQLESALFEITACAVDSHSIKEYAQKLHSIIDKLTNAKNFFVALYKNNNQIIDFVYIADEYDSLSIESVLNQLSSKEIERTLTGYLLKTKKTQHILSEEVDNLIKNGVVDNVGEPSSDWLGVPLMYDSEILGALVIQSYQENFIYSDKDVAIMEFVARQTALVIKSKQAQIDLIATNRELETRVKERTQALNSTNEALKEEINQRIESQQVQEALFQITELVSTSNDLVDLYQGVYNIINRLMFARNQYIALLTKDKKHIEFPFFKDEFDDVPKSRSISKDANFTEKVLTSGKSVLYQRREIEEVESVGTRSKSWLGVPLNDKGNVFGVLAIQSYQSDKTYTQQDKQVLTTIGQQVATAILRKKDADSLLIVHESLERRVKERTFELEETIKKRKKVEERLAFETLHDSLTGLPNRGHLSKKLNDLLLGEFRHQQIMALLFLDLDRFKVINDSLGHHIGDQFLIAVAHRLQECVRAEDLVARLGGDEFCILMPSIKRNSIAFSLCARLLKALKKPLEVSGHSLITSASIGVRLVSPLDASAEVIMSDADAAMYQAKHQGKNQYCVFDSNIKKLVTDRMVMENELREAVEKKQLFLMYQPIVDIVSNELVGLEALVRWRHKDKGYISPEKFIAVAEETGIIVELGEAVIDMACKKLSELQKDPNLNKLYININVSPVQILSRNLDQVLRNAINAYKISTKYLRVEITESILIEDYTTALSFVREMRAMGVKIYLDDFGTGFSSLSYLHKFPFDVIKLDRSFIDALNESHSNFAIVESIVLLANNLDIPIVAEGVETKTQLQLIKKMGYRYGQGYYFSRPVKASEIAQLKNEIHSKVEDINLSE